MAVLIDFGFAHHRGYPDLLAEERQFTAGSAAHVSPEQILGTREDPRSDIFALGVLLYQMATGKLPFGEPDTDVRNRLWLDPTPPVVHSATLQPALQEVILRCVEPRAELRYQSSAMVAFDLRMPEQVELTARGTKLRRASLLKQFKRYWTTRGQRLPEAPASRSPIIMVPVDTTRMDDELQPALREATAKFLSLNNDYRLICASVIADAPIIDGADPNETASGLHLEHLIRLRQWVAPPGLPPHRFSLHAMASSDPEKVLVDLARCNHVDLIVLGAAGQNQRDRAWWRSATSTLIANARCDVHVVRVREPDGFGPHNQ